MISFIIPAKNEENYLCDCLRSVMSQETNEPFEIIVVDNNSSDHTSDIARQTCSSSIVVKETAPGTSAARQRGFLEAKGEWLVFLDADVRLPDSQWLNRLLRKLDKTDIVAVSSHYRYYGVAWYLRAAQMFGTFAFIYPWIFLTNIALRHSSHVIGGMMAIKKAALLEVGGFGEETEFYGDEVLVSKKLYSLGKMAVSPALWVYTSGRRYLKHGMAKTVFKYVFNYFWTLFTGKPYHKGSDLP